ncbi:MAG: helix-turn-helix domain-containing protein [Blastocatellia bacterium]
MMKKFGQTLEKKRKQAQLSITELASLSGLPESSLEAMEQGSGDAPNFDTCYRLGQAISQHGGQMFVLQDLWQALRADKLESNPAAGVFFVQ